LSRLRSGAATRRIGTPRLRRDMLCCAPSLARTPRGTPLGAHFVRRDSIQSNRAHDYRGRFFFRELIN